MLIVMDQAATQDEIAQVIAAVEKRGFTARPIAGGNRVAIGVLYNPGSVDPAPFAGLAGVKKVIPVTSPYKLVSREFHPESTRVRVGSVSIGEGSLTIIAGPCAIESEEQALTVARRVRQAGATLFRGGAYKPRSSPYSFQGLEEAGLRILERVRRETGLPIVTEAVDQEVYALVEEAADMVQIGARNMQNFSLLKRAGRSPKPVLLKRGQSATMEEWLMAAEYILERGNQQVVLCERGVRTFARHCRNTLDLSAVPFVQRESHLPILVDPSHATGMRYQVLPLSRAAVAAGAHGVMVEVHHAPEEALCDGAQSLRPEQFETLCGQLRQVYGTLHSETDGVDR